MGASAFHKVVCADDAIGIEEVVEPWCSAMVQFVSKVFGELDKTPTTPSDLTSKTEVVVSIDTEAKPLLSPASTSTASSITPSAASTTQTMEKVVLATSTQATASTEATTKPVGRFSMSASEQALRARALLGRGGRVNFRQHNDLTSQNQPISTPKATAIAPKAAGSSPVEPNISQIPKRTIDADTSTGTSTGIDTSTATTIKSDTTDMPTDSPDTGGSKSTPETQSAPRLLIAYGSQTGCAQSIANQLCTDIRHSVGAARVTLSDLNEWRQKLDEFAKFPYVIILCSTTGAGDPPDNADRFWRAIRKRSMAETAFEGVKFSVLALGDTNYDKFCQAGKRINKRLKVRNLQTPSAP